MEFIGKIAEVYSQIMAWNLQADAAAQAEADR